MLLYYWKLFIGQVLIFYLLQLSFIEDENGYAHYVMSIVHNAACYMPDLLDHMAENYPNLTVKNGVLGRNSDIESSNMVHFKEQVNFNLVSKCYFFLRLYPIVRL